MHKLVVAFIIALLVLVIALISTLILKEPILPLTASMRDLRRHYISRSYDPYDKYNSAQVPAIVNSIIWDFRALDTYFETIVFFTALIAALTIYHEYLVEVKLYSIRKHLHIPSNVLKLILPIALGISIGVAVKGIVSPGGGFQGGVLLALSVYLLINTSLYYRLFRNSHELLLLIRSVSIILISLMAILPYLLFGDNCYLFQVSVKQKCAFGLIASVYGSRVSLVPIIYNFLEYLAISAGFILLLLIIIIGGYKEKIP